jgi:hypothetical protein
MFTSSKAVLIPHKNGWSTRKDAYRHAKNCYKELKKTGVIPPEWINHFWLLEGNLNNRGYPLHRKLATRIFNAYTTIEDQSCESVGLTLKNLLKVLRRANKWRKQKLALKKAGNSKAQ